MKTSLGTVRCLDQDSYQETPEHESRGLPLSQPARFQYFANCYVCIYTGSQEERSIFWEVIVSVIVSIEVYVYMCPIPNGFRDRAISLYSSKTLDKKEILRLVSNNGIYCLSDKVGTVYLV
jgi:hypothetical protein